MAHRSRRTNPLQSLPLILAIAACSQGAGEDTLPAKPHAALTLDQLQFDDVDTQVLHARLRALAQQRGASWTHSPLKRGGSFIREAWCAGEGGCKPSKLTQDLPPGAEWIGVNTLAYGNSFPAVFGVGLTAGRLTGPWPTRVAVSLRGRKINGSHYTLAFYSLDGEALTERLVVTDSVPTNVAHTELVWRLPGAGSDETRPAEIDTSLRVLLGSPEGFVETALAMVDGVHAARSTLLASGEAYRCEYDLSQSKNGTPPPCQRIPLTDAEQAQWAATIDGEAEEARALLVEHGESLHSSLVSVLPAAAWGG